MKMLWCPNVETHDGRIEELPFRKLVGESQDLHL